LLVATGILNVVAALIAFVFQVGSETTSTTTTSCLDVGQDDSSSVSVHTNVQANSSFCRGNSVLLVIFQLAIIVVSMQGPIANITSNTFWILVVAFLVTLLLLFSIRKWPISKCTTGHSVGLFLVLRHAIPTCDYLMESFFYSKLKSKPILLQTLSIINMGVTTLSSWSYGKIFTKTNKSLVFVIFLTTIVSSCAVLGNLVLVADSSKNDLTFFMLVVTFGSITTFAAEWQFLPDVVLATAASVGSHNDDDDDEPLTMLVVEDPSQDSTECADETPNSIMDSTGMRYGTLISCIDFGDQIGSWVTVPIVTALGISRDNDWANLYIFIILSAALGLSSLLLLKILKQER
jgi:phage-related holin